jgi:hypothetical protein
MFIEYNPKFQVWILIPSVFVPALFGLLVTPRGRRQEDKPAYPKGEM